MGLLGNIPQLEKIDLPKSTEPLGRGFIGSGRGLLYPDDPNLSKDIKTIIEGLK